MLVFVALVAIFLFLASQLPGPYLQRQQAPGPRLFIVGELATFCVPVFLATWIMGLIERRSAWSYGLADPRAIRHFLWGAFWGFVLLSGIVGLLVVTGHLSFEGTALSGTTALRFAIEWAIGFMLVGIGEEMAFRGYLQVALMRSVGFWPAAILLSLAFGALHMVNAGEGLIGELTAGLAGFVFCYSLWRTGSLCWAIGAHMSWDWAQSYFYGVPDSGGMVSRHLLISHASGTTWLSGGTVGPEGSIFAFLALIAFVVVLRLTTPGHEAAADGPALAIQMGHAGHNLP